MPTTIDFTTLSPQQVLDLGKPSEEFKEAAKSYKSPGLDWSDPTKALALLRYYVDSVIKADIKDPDVAEETLQAPARDGTSLPLKLFRPADTATNASLPLIVLYFPGGFIIGDPMALAPLARTLVKQLKVIVVAPTHRLAPDHPFPTGVEDSSDALSWIAKNAGTFGADPSQGFVVGGISSGGNITNAIVHLARDKGMEPPVTGVWLSCAGARLAPSRAHLLPQKYRERYLSRTQDECTSNATASSGLEQFKRAALKPDLDSPLYAPLIWSSEGDFGHKGFPKTYSQVAGSDPARDDVLVFDDMLKTEGIPTRLDLYPGLPHFFYYTFKDLPQSKQWEQDTVDGFAWLLGVEKR